MQTQIFLASRTLRENPDALGTQYINESWSGTTPANGVYYTRFDDTYTLPLNYEDATYRAALSATSTASYNVFGFRIYVYLNDVQVYLAESGISFTSYYRNNSGTLSYQYDVTAGAGDTIRILGQSAGRPVGGSTPSSSLSAILDLEAK